MNYTPQSSAGTNSWFAWRPPLGDQIAWVTSQWNAGAQSEQLSFGSIVDKAIFNTILCESY